jgi:hypothetical protein
MHDTTSLHAIRALGAAAALVGAMVAWSPARAQAPDPFTGVWRLSAEKSLYEYGRPPKSFTRTYEDRGSGVVYLTVDSVSATGAATRVHVVYKRDGKPYPESAVRSRTLQMVTVRAVDANTEEMVRAVDGRPTDPQTLTLSKDRLTLTHVMKGITADGRPFTNVIVYDKQ